MSPNPTNPPEPTLPYKNIVDFFFNFFRYITPKAVQCGLGSGSDAVEPEEADLAECLLPQGLTLVVIPLFPFSFLFISYFSHYSAMRVWNHFLKSFRAGNKPLDLKKLIYRQNFHQNSYENEENLKILLIFIQKNRVRGTIFDLQPLYFLSILLF